MIQDVNSEPIGVVIIAQPTVPNKLSCPNVEPGHILIDKAEYDARVILCIKTPASENKCRPGKFTPYCRNSHEEKQGLQWWSFTRLIPPVSYTSFKRLQGTVFHVLQFMPEWKKLSAEHVKMDFHRSLGSQVHVVCNCAGDNPFLFIGSGKEQEDKRSYMVHGWNTKEHCICCDSLFCNTRISVEHFEDHHKGEKRYLDPPSN